MEQKYHTIELARLYEDQGHYSNALENYSFLLNQDENNEKLSEAVQRIKFKMEQKNAANQEKSSNQENEGNQENTSDEEQKIRKLFEEWINLLILKKKLVMYEAIQKDLLWP